MAKRAGLDGVAVVVQPPNGCAEEIAYVREIVQDRYAQMPQAQGRLGELGHHLPQRRASKKRTEMAVAVARPLEEEGPCPQAPDAFDHGLCARSP